jgi:ribonuclease HI
LKLRVYTDGACSGNPGAGGWAWTYNEKEDSGGEKNTTNNRMELRAVVEALTEIYECGYEKVKVEIYSDSAYVINAINKEWINKWQRNNWVTTKDHNVKNKDLWEDLIRIKKLLSHKNIKISFIKVKGHDGNELNEVCDKLARKESQKLKGVD